jgi:hypothetical protein
VFTVIAEDEVTVEQVEELVNNENFDTLDSSQIQAIAIALSDEEDEVKEVFEDNVDIFEGATDDYVPSGSTVTVAERRIIIAATAVVLSVPLPAPKPASPSPGGSGGAPSSGGGGSPSEGGSGKKRRK